MTTTWTTEVLREEHRWILRMLACLERVGAGSEQRGRLDASVPAALLLAAFLGFRFDPWIVAGALLAHGALDYGVITFSIPGRSASGTRATSAPAFRSTSVAARSSTPSASERPATIGNSSRHSVPVGSMR